MGLRVIDGTPTAISKFIREEEDKKHPCPKCGSEMRFYHKFEEDVEGYDVPIGDFYACKCGHEEKVKDRGA